VNSEHHLSTGRGQLIKCFGHTRDVTNSVNKAQMAIDKLLLFKATDFLQVIRIEKSRYARDQFKLLQTLCDNYGVDAVLNGIDYCQVSKLFGASYIRDFLKFNAKPKQEIVLNTIPLSDSKYHVTTEKRSLDLYVKAGGKP